MSTQPNSFRTMPDERGHFGQFGGRYVADTLMPLILDLERASRAATADPPFQPDIDYLLKHFLGSENPHYFAPRLTEAPGGAKVYLKLEHLYHTGAHKHNKSN